jgi:hypothetical protein
MYTGSSVELSLIRFILEWERDNILLHASDGTRCLLIYSLINYRISCVHISETNKILQVYIPFTSSLIESRLLCLLTPTFSSGKSNREVIFLIHSDSFWQHLHYTLASHILPHQEHK